MNPISQFLIKNLIGVYFIYGLAFFTLGLAVALAGRRVSQFRFARTLGPLAWFGLLHGAHEWWEMLAKIAALSTGYVPPIWQESLRIALMGISFLCLAAFGILLLRPGEVSWHQVARPLGGMVAVYSLGVVIALGLLATTAHEALHIAEALVRYCWGIPAALLAAWALMLQQRTFREHGMPQFGRDLVWCAAALLLYGGVGQLFASPSALFPSTLINTSSFLEWFGIPVQLFRTVMATVLTLFMVRALNAFDIESQRQLDKAHQERLRAQEAALQAERRISREMERLNEELRLATQELSLLLDLTNLLARPTSLSDRLHAVLERLVGSLSFPDAGIISLRGRHNGDLRARATVGFAGIADGTGEAAGNADFQRALELGQRSADKTMAVCLHLDGTIIEFALDEEPSRERCERHGTTLVTLAVPLSAQGQVIGSLVLHRPTSKSPLGLSHDEFTLILGVAQQLGLTIDNARLQQEAQAREHRLAELLRQVVGAQEAERQRISRELHDATGQSLTAVALGLQGMEAMLAQDATTATQQIPQLRSFATKALGELRGIIAGLRPPQLDDLGLAAALQWYVKEMETHFGLQVTFDPPAKPIRLPSDLQTVLFRIAQEALINAAKHSQADQVVVSLEAQPSQVLLTVEDNGQGFDVERTLQQGTPAGWGLLGMQERASLVGAHYEIISQPGEGTRVSVTLPLVQEIQDEKNPTTAG